MRAFDSTVLGRMRGTQEGAMQDLCVVLGYGEMGDGYGLPKPVWGANPVEVECGLELVGPDEEQGTGEVAVIDARLRLPVGTVVDVRDRVMVIERYGEELGASDVLLFEIEGPAQRGASGLVLSLRLVDDE